MNRCFGFTREAGDACRRKYHRNPCNNCACRLSSAVFCRQVCRYEHLLAGCVQIWEDNMALIVKERWTRLQYHDHGQ